MLQVENNRVGILYIGARILINNVYQKILGIFFIVNSVWQIGGYAECITFCTGGIGIHRKELGGIGCSHLFNTPFDG